MPDITGTVMVLAMGQGLRKKGRNGVGDKCVRFAKHECCSFVTVPVILY